jgi:hypothetical protein
VAINQYSVTVGTGAALLATAGGSMRVALSWSSGSGPLFVGNSSVASSGFPITSVSSYEPITFNLATGDSLYAVWLYGGTKTVYVMTTP